VTCLSGLDSDTGREGLLDMFWFTNEEIQQRPEGKKLFYIMRDHAGTASHQSTLRLQRCMCKLHASLAFTTEILLPAISTAETARLSSLDILKSSCSTKRDSTCLVVPNFYRTETSAIAGQTAVQSSFNRC